MRQIILDSSYTFIQILEKLDKFKNEITSNPKFIFRGQSDVNWTLQPSFTRIVLQKKLDRTQSLQLEHECLDKFLISAKNLLLPQQTIPLLIEGKNDFIPWLIYMQHFSSPTRMLDWTTSSIVALYFSCIDNYDYDGAIFVTDCNKIPFNPNLQKLFLEGVLNPDSRDILMNVTAFVSNERLEAQQGKFTVCTNPLIDHQEILIEIDALTKIIIPKELKLMILKHLYQMNINAKTLFPGIDGLGKSILEYSILWNQ